VHSWGIAIGIHSQANNNTFKNNIFEYGNVNIRGKSNYFIDNDILVGRVDLINASDNKLINNWIKDDDTVCVVLEENSSSNYFSNNIVESTRIGILVKAYCNNNTFTSNILRDNMEHGLEIEQNASDNSVFGNTFENNDFENAIDNGQHNKWNNTINLEIRSLIK